MSLTSRKKVRGYCLAIPAERDNAGQRRARPMQWRRLYCLWAETLRSCFGLSKRREMRKNKDFVRWTAEIDDLMQSMFGVKLESFPKFDLEKYFLKNISPDNAVSVLVQDALQQQRHQDILLLVNGLSSQIEKLLKQVGNLTHAQFELVRMASLCNIKIMDPQGPTNALEVN
jgi:hypothetical protein